MNNNRKKKTQTQTPGEERLKSFLDMIAPSVIQFYTDHYICGNTFRSVWALREYPTATDEQAILRHLGEKDGVTLRIYTRQVTPAEEKKIISNAANKNRMKQGNTENLQETVTAASNLQDVTNIIATMHRNREPLLHTAVYLELSAADMDKLKLLQTEVLTELIRSKLNVDKLLLRQKQGFLCVHPAGRNVFLEQFERALPASSVANLFPFNYSGKTDKNGFYIGRAHNRYHFRLCAFLCAFCNIISLLRIPRLITVQNKEDFSALISKVSSTMKVTLGINYVLFRLNLR